MNVGQGGTAGEARKNKHCVHLQQKLKISEMWGAEMKCVFCFLGLSSNSPPPPLLSLNKLSSVVSPQNAGDTPSNLNSKLVEPSLKTDFVVFLKHICWEPKCWVAVGAIVSVEMMRWPDTRWPWLVSDILTRCHIHLHQSTNMFPTTQRLGHKYNVVTSHTLRLYFWYLRKCKCNYVNVIFS